MIIEELEGEIDQKTNKLVIEYLASLFVSGSNNLENQEWFTHLDYDIQNIIKLYNNSLRDFIRCKRIHKNNTRSYPRIRSSDQYQSAHNLIESNYEKLRLRQILNLRGVDYKKYHYSNIL